MRGVVITRPMVAKSSPWGNHIALPKTPWAYAAIQRRLKAREASSLRLQQCLARPTRKTSGALIFAFPLIRSFTECLLRARNVFDPSVACNAAAGVSCRSIARESQQVSLVRGTYSEFSAEVEGFSAGKTPACG
jgi:hypothetical protein